MTMRGPATLALAAAALGIAAAPASAAPPCESISAVVQGLDDGNVVATGRSTRAIKISGQDEGEITNVVASVPAPGAVQATRTAPGRYSLAFALPAAGTVRLTISWDEVSADTPADYEGRVITCTQTTQIVLRAARPAAIGVRGEETSFENGIVADFVFPGCRAAVVAAPVTVTVRYRLGPKGRPRRVPIPPAPTARSPKLVLVLPDPCAVRLPRRSVSLPGRGSVFVGPGERGLAVVAKRTFAGRGAYAAHYIVEFAQPGFRTVRFDIIGTFNLSANGKASGSQIRRLG